MTADERETLEVACTHVGIGVVTLQSRERGADTVRRRAVVAWVLEQEGWPQKRIASALHREVRQVRNLLKTQKS